MHKRGRQLVVSEFESIFGSNKKPEDAPAPDSVGLPKIEYSAQYDELREFMASQNLDDADNTIKINLRIRPRTDPELASKERRKRSYQPITENEIISFGKGSQARHYHYNVILPETATQEDVINQTYKIDPRTAFIVYGQTGSGKTYTMSGGAWKNDGLIQNYFKRLSARLN